MNRAFALLVAAIMLASCSSNRPIYNVDDHPIPAAAQDLPLDRIGALIVEAGQKRNWAFQRAGAGHLVATQANGKYIAVVDIYFDQKSYRIQKKSTTGLSDADGMIDRHYNNWIHYLENDIQAQLAKATP